jgi:DNA-binding NarL/FixJ family response regulator
MPTKIRVAILDDHQGIIDGYQFRLNGAADIEVVATALYGEELEPILANNQVDVLLLDVHVPSSASNPNPYPILYQIPKLLQIYPDLSVLVISMHAQRTLINAIMESGASGYILKDDQASIRELASIVRMVANGGVHLSPLAYQQLLKRHTGELGQPLTPRQLEALSLCAAHPGASTAELAQKMNIAHSTMRNLLSGTYLKLKVRTRAEAVARARQSGLITPEVKLPKI